MRGAGSQAVRVWLVTCVLTSAAADRPGSSDGRSVGRAARLWPRGSPSPSPPEGRTACAPYRGQVCAFLLLNQTVLVRPPDTLAIVEERVRDALSVVQDSPDLSQECSEFAAPGICLAAFPPCGAGGEPRRICRDECELLRDARCKREHAIALAHPILSQVELPVCERLPPVGGPEAAGCLRLGVPDVAPPRPEDACFHGDGAGYRGVEARAASGRRCRAWSRHGQYARLARRQPAVLGGHAFCRKWPGEGRPQPWCYTASEGGGVQAELCAVPRCHRPLLWYIWYIVLPCGSLAVLALLSAAIGCLCRCARRGPASKPSADTKLTVVAEKPRTDPELAADPPPKPQSIELELKSISFKEELGEGQFGKVFRGELSDYGTDGAPLPVAVKTLKEDVSARTERDFEREGRLLAELCHPNIVRLLGVVQRATPRCLVFERMSGGDLHALLVARSPRGDGVAGPPLTEQHLLHIATQVADGMAYLGTHHYVHRDLAARNCLVGDNLTVKISDFGLSRDIYSSDYYRLQSRALLPVRWMPAESILYGKFTTESDVHSYGVLLWELFSFGLQPYYGYSSAEVVEMVRRRQLLPRPDDAPVAVYQLMLDCWQQTPGRRPTFDQILARLSEWRRAGAVGGARPLAAAAEVGRSLGQLPEDGPPRPGPGACRSASLPRGAAPAALRGGSLPRPAAPGGGSLPRPAAPTRPLNSRTTEVVLGRVSSASSLPSSQIDRL
ncbi:inactive tyrosine-protein kinase transmembrane receptor ROR1-like [Amphibalanus amphitrite]|uniref:inactive tyrosine-protein kinase transmembrane receptor ROR1-like n=1 Tax=Amphibalanus amphitrite TaxID=1232801 RepID=UPI001C914F21|nr:inactive tyrosine-protein kinase transmembrane receptor ROR1-like [Amphibalanus amphitrite]